MKKQDKSYLILGLLSILLISLWCSSWQLQEGFKEGASKAGKDPVSKALKQIRNP
jgi:hypothetical protein